MSDTNELRERFQPLNSDKLWDLAQAECHAFECNDDGRLDEYGMHFPSRAALLRFAALVIDLTDAERAASPFAAPTAPAAWPQQSTEAWIAETMAGPPPDHPVWEAGPQQGEPRQCNASHLCDCQEAGQPCVRKFSDAVAWRDHVERQIRTWRQRQMNDDGDRFALRDYMGAEAMEDLIDFVCDEYAGPRAAIAAPSANEQSYPAIDPLTGEANGPQCCGGRDGCDVREYCAADPTALAAGPQQGGAFCNYVGAVCASNCNPGQCVERVEPEVPHLYQHALSELQNLGYAVEDGELMPPATGIPVPQRPAPAVERGVADDTTAFKAAMKTLHHVDFPGGSLWDITSIYEKSLMLKAWNAAITATGAAQGDGAKTDLHEALRVEQKLSEHLRKLNEKLLDKLRHKEAPAGAAQGVTDDMRHAVRFAPSSAYWSQRLREIFGPDARDGIDALEADDLVAIWRAARAQQEAPAAQPLTDEQITTFGFTDSVALMASMEAAYRAGVRRAEHYHGIQPAATKGTE